MQLHPDLSSPPPLPPLLLFPLPSDGILLFRLTAVWLEVLWHQTLLLYLTEMPKSAVTDRPTLQSAQHASALSCLLPELLSLPVVREMRASGLNGSHDIGFAAVFLSEFDCFCDVNVLCLFYNSDIISLQLATCSMCFLDIEIVTSLLYWKKKKEKRSGNGNHTNNLNLF